MNICVRVLLYIWRLDGGWALSKNRSFTLINHLNKNPLSAESIDAVYSGRREIIDLLRGDSRKLLVILGPCSIHDEAMALEYAERLQLLVQRYKDRITLVMRAYFEKPRSTVGWKGLVYDPRMDGSNRMEEGLLLARSIMCQITAKGIPVATEFLDPIVPQYIDDLVSWAAIGARTTESQIHRQMASGLSMPVGFKNGTDG